MWEKDKMSPEQVEHLQNISLIASVPVGLVMFFGSYWLYKTRRTNTVYRAVTAGMILATWLCAYLVDRTFHIFVVISSAGMAAYWFGKVRAMNKHPEAFPFPPYDKPSDD